MTEPSPLVVQALGCSVRVEFDPSAEHLEPEVRHAWAACAAPEQSPARSTTQRLRLAVGAECVPGTVWAPEPDPLMERLAQHLTLRGIHALGGERLMFHAAGIANRRTGDTAVLVGPSGVGKSTLVRTLGPRWAYVTDETVAMDEQMSLLPYPKPVLVRRGDNPFKHAVAPSDLGLSPPDVPLRVAAVVLLRREADVAQLDVEPLRTVPALAELAAHTSHLAQLERPLHRMAEVLHAVGGLQVAHYSESKQLEPLLEEVLGP